MDDRYAELRRFGWFTQALFVVCWAVAWVYRAELLEWVGRPALESFRDHAQRVPGYPIPVWRSPGLEFYRQLRLTVTPALLALLPLLMLQVWGFASPRSFAPVRAKLRAFFWSSYAAVAVGTFVTARFAAPAVFDELLARSASWSLGAEQLALDAYVALLSWSTLGVCFNLELGVIALFARITKSPSAA